MRSSTAALVTRLEEAQKQDQLDRVLNQLDLTDLLICDELGYLSFSQFGAERRFQLFADRYERRGLPVTSNLAFSEWGQVFQGEWTTAALLDRLTHRCHTPVRFSTASRRGRIEAEPCTASRRTAERRPGIASLAGVTELAGVCVTVFGGFTLVAQGDELAVGGECRRIHGAAVGEFQGSLQLAGLHVPEENPSLAQVASEAPSGEKAIACT